MIINDKNQIFHKLEKILKPFEKKLNFKTDGKSKCELITKRTVTVYNKEHNGMFFASAVIQKNFVGFYFFPIYTHVKEFNNIPPELKKCLKGKSCFNIKKFDNVLEKQISDILKKGYEVYKKAGWA